MLSPSPRKTTTSRKGRERERERERETVGVVVLDFGAFFWCLLFLFDVENVTRDLFFFDVIP